MATTPWAGKMNQILRCDWLPEQPRWSYLARKGLASASRKKNFPESHILNALLTKLGQDGLLASFVFCELMDRERVEFHKHAKKERGEYPVIFTSHLYVFEKRLLFQVKTGGENRRFWS